MGKQIVGDFAPERKWGQIFRAFSNVEISDIFDFNRGNAIALQLEKSGLLNGRFIAHFKGKRNEEEISSNFFF